jgi:hypothetical protein
VLWINPTHSPRFARLQLSDVAVLIRRARRTATAKTTVKNVVTSWDATKCVKSRYHPVAHAVEPRQQVVPPAVPASTPVEVDPVGQHRAVQHLVVRLQVALHPAVKLLAGL